MSAAELRELDAWILEYVIGLKPVGKLWLVEEGTFGIGRDGIPCVHIRGNEIEECSPTTDPAAAMAVLEKCIEKCGVVKVIGIGARRWVNDNQQSCEGAEDTLPLAICLFAKKLFSREEK